MQRELARRLGQGHGRVSPQVVELHEHVRFDRGGEQSSSESATDGMAQDLFAAFSGVDEPLLDGRQIFEHFRPQDAGDRAAMRVTADDDVLDLEHLDGVLDGGRLAVRRQS